jgi:hypothetical protein
LLSGYCKNLVAENQLSAAESLAPELNTLLRREPLAAKPE